MKAKAIILIIGICLFPVSSLKAQVIGIQWNTFLGSSYYDCGYSISSDSSGNILVTGMSNWSWGSPINAHAGGYDAFVFKLDNNGNLLWNTFLGSVSDDKSYGIVLDGTGNIYVTGYSTNSWGTPINPFEGNVDAFVAKLDTNGNLLWNTFLGSGDDGRSISSDSSGNIYVMGESYNSWGSPINPHSGDFDIFVAKLDSNGNLQWNTFQGSASVDYSYGIKADNSGNVHITGISDASWGSPINPLAGGTDAFVAKLNSNGILLWSTFLGSGVYDEGRGITVDSTGDICVTGYSGSSWGSPVNPHAGGGEDAFIAKLNGSGTLLWNTFMGSGDWDRGYSIVSDSSGNVYVTGFSVLSWGSPINPFTGGFDSFIFKLDKNGNLLWNTFLGSSFVDIGYSITLDNVGNIYVSGESSDTWGTPINSHTGSYDAFVVKITPIPPVPDIQANGSDGPIIITQSDTLQVTVALDSKGNTDNADWWLLANTPFGWYYYDYSTKKWKPGKNVTRQGRLMDLNPKTVLNTSGLKTGTYTFYFGVDMNMDGNLTKSELYYDQVKVTVTQ